MIISLKLSQLHCSLNLLEVQKIKFGFTGKIISYMIVQVFFFVYSKCYLPLVQSIFLLS